MLTARDRYRRRHSLVPMTLVKHGICGSALLLAALPSPVRECHDPDALLDGP
jgi:hypothetical protein